MWSYTSCQTYYGLRNVMHVKDFFSPISQLPKWKSEQFCLWFAYNCKGGKKDYFLHWSKIQWWKMVNKIEYRNHENQRCMENTLSCSFSNYVSRSVFFSLWLHCLWTPFLFCFVLFFQQGAVALMNKSDPLFCKGVLQNSNMDLNSLITSHPMHF